MEQFKIWSDNPSQKNISEIAELLEKGYVGIIPTDTIYAFTCDALNSKAIDRICKIKGLNPDKNNLSIICSDFAMASEYARIENSAFNVMRENLPGQFTFILRSSSSLPKSFKRRKSVGIRIPDNPFCRDLTETLGRPIMVSSILFDNDDYAREPELIKDKYKNLIDFFVDGGDGSSTPSTIVEFDNNEPVVIRQGCGILK